jgi:hypothetical protein
VQEPEETESSSTQAGTKRRHADIQNDDKGDNVLVNFSRAALDKLLQLHPGIFNIEWKDEVDPASWERRAVGRWH